MNQDDLVNGPTAVASDVEAGLKPSAPSTVLSPGDFAGDYKILRHIGGGAMGDVYEGLHEDIGKRVAVKVIKNVLADSDEAAERFKREARAVNRIDHPNVLDVFAFGRLDDGRLYLAMDMLEGESLGDRIRGGGALSLDEFAEVIAPICSALSAAHDEGIIHRDLKPDNVFLCKAADGADRVFVLDFGIAKILSDVANETGKGTLTGEGVWIGTPAYMAPEQWAAEGASPRSDIYALGAMAYEMLAGTVPYKAQSVPAIMEKHFHEDVPHLDTGSGRQPLPEGVDRAVRKAMAKKPESRFESAAEFLGELQAAIAGVSRPAGKAAVAGAAPTEQGGIEKKRPLPVWAAAIGAVVLAAAIALVVLMQRGDDRTDAGVSASNADSPEATEPEADTEAIPEGKVLIRFETTPAGAQAYIGDKNIGPTPAKHTFDAGERFSLSLRKPGYTHTPERLSASKDEIHAVALTPVKGFEGVWQLPDGRFRQFERHKHQVIAWKLLSAAGDGKQELGTFEFIPGEDPAKVVFARATEVVDERNPSHEGCRRRLGAQYRFDIESRLLELRLESDAVDFADGACAVTRTWWEPYKPLRRVETAATDGVVTSSRAGAGRARPSDRGNTARPSKAKGKNAKRDPKAEARRRQLLEQKKQLAQKREKALEQRATKDVSPRASDPNQKQRNNIDPAPLGNVQKAGLEPAKRQTSRAPVKGGGKPRSKKRKKGGKRPPAQQQTGGLKK